jgi:predicted anti-sigma-YlaC factor YlaD
LTCYLTRRRIGAWLDGALPDGTARVVATHLDGCAGCRGEAQILRRTRELVRAAATAAEPDWTGFWAGIVRGIEAGSAGPARVRDLLAPRRRFALVGALAAALLAVTVWSGDSPTMPQLVTSVALADTEYPHGSVMVYTPPEDDMTVIWVFGSDNHSSGNEI